MATDNAVCGRRGIRATGLTIAGLLLAACSSPPVVDDVSEPAEPVDDAAAVAARYGCDDVESCANLGVELYRDGVYLDAAAVMEHAYACEPVPVILYNIARSYEEAGRCELAVEYFDHYLATRDYQAADQARVRRVALGTCAEVGGETSVQAEEARRAIVLAALDLARIAVARARREADRRADRSARQRQMPWISARSDVHAAARRASWMFSPPPLSGLPLDIVLPAPGSTDWWFDVAPVEADDGRRLLAVVHSSYDTTSTHCIEVEEAEGCEAEFWELSLTEDADLEVDDWLAEYVLSALAGTAQPVTPQFEGVSDNEIWLSFVEREASGPPRIVERHLVGSSVSGVGRTRFHTADLDRDGTTELLVTNETEGNPECVVGEPDIQHTLVVDLGDLSVELRRVTEDDFPALSRPFGEITSFELIPSNSSHPDLMERIVEYDDCEIVDRQPVGPADDDSECAVDERLRRWSYDPEKDRWTDPVWVEPPPDAEVGVDRPGCR